MIEVLALAGAISTISSTISSAITAGKDIHSVLPEFGKLAELESEVRLAESGKHKGPLGRLSSSDQEGFAIAQAKIALKDAHNDLRSLCLLYGPPNMWEIVLREQASARVRHREALEVKIKKRDKLLLVVYLLFGAFLFIAISSGMIYGAAVLAALANQV